MSIAVSAVVRTPVALRLLQACLGSCAIGAAWPLSGLAWPATAPLLVQLAGGYALPLPAALLSLAGGVLLLACACRARKVLVLDISPVGQLRLAVYVEQGSLPGQLQRMLPGSTLWPGWLVLCLHGEDGRRRSVLAQRDARGCPAFRALAVACRAIGTRKEQR